MLLVLWSAAANALPQGRPPIRSWPPDLDVYPQNFAIAVDGISRVFIGNAEGVLIFDGDVWQLVPTANGDLVRSLHFDAALNRVYVGGYDAFGYLERTATGRYVYHDLTEEFAPALQGKRFADIWRIAVTPEAVWFVALHDVFRWEPATGQRAHFHHAGRFGEIAWFAGRLLLQFRGEGLRAWTGDGWQSLPGPDLTRLLAAMVALDDHRLLLVSNDGPWYVFDGARFRPFADIDAIPHRGAITSALTLDPGTIVFATQLGKVVFYDVETRRTNVIDISNDFLPDLARSPAGDLLVVDNLAFHNVTWPATWRVVREGLAGNVYRFVAVGEDVYALTSSGAFVARAGVGRFERLPWTSFEAWDLLPLADGGMLFADSYQIVYFAPDGQREVVDERTTARVFQPSRHDPDIVFVGTELGLQVLERRNGRWRVVLRDDAMDALGVTDIVETAEHELLLGSERGGVRQVRFTPGASWAMHQHRLDAAHGLDYGKGPATASLARLGADIIAATSAGWFRWDGTRFTADDADGASGAFPAGEAVRFAVQGSQRWAHTWRRLFRHTPDGWVEEDVAGLRRGALSTVAFAGEQVVVGDLGGLLLYAPAAATPPATPHHTVSLLAARAQRNGTPRQQLSLRLAAPDIRPDDRLTLRFGSIDLRDPAAVSYRTRLSPREQVFSPWSRERQQSFLGLRPGRYTFEVQARDGQARTAGLSVPLLVRPRWFEHPLTRAVAVVLVLLAFHRAVVSFAEHRSRQLTAERDRLERTVAERTRALRAANHQLMEMAHLDGLTQIPNRRRLDDYLDDVRRQCVEHGRVMSVAVIDVDYFKQYNDTHGHQAGDELLVALAAMLSRCLRRAEDLVARYGGEEFIVVLPGADAAAAGAVVEEMRRAVAAGDLGVTISVGVYTVAPAGHASTKEMIAAADAALYDAKRAGRNRVVAR